MNDISNFYTPNKRRLKGAHIFYVTRKPTSQHDDVELRIFEGRARGRGETIKKMKKTKKKKR